MELDFHVARENSKLFINLAYQKSVNQFNINDLDAFRIPKLTASVGASYELNDSNSLGADISYIGARQNLDAYSVVNVNYTLQLDRLDIFLTIRNLFDENILNPNNTTQNSTLVAKGEEGTQLQLGFRFNF